MSEAEREKHVIKKTGYTSYACETCGEDLHGEEEALHHLMGKDEALDLTERIRLLCLEGVEMLREAVDLLDEHFGPVLEKKSGSHWQNVKNCRTYINTHVDLDRIEGRVSGDCSTIARAFLREEKGE